ncbi:MAG: hypothetical protein ACYS32_16990 [Planctomycetota bacterium]
MYEHLPKFDREQVPAVLGIGDIELTITGQLTDETHFEAKDKIIFIYKQARTF